MTLLEDHALVEVKQLPHVRGSRSLPWVSPTAGLTRYSGPTCAKAIQRYAGLLRSLTVTSVEEWSLLGCGRVRDHRVLDLSAQLDAATTTNSVCDILTSIPPDVTSLCLSNVTAWPEDWSANHKQLERLEVTSAIPLPPMAGLAVLRWVSGATCDDSADGAGASACDPSSSLAKLPRLEVLHLQGFATSNHRLFSRISGPCLVALSLEKVWLHGQIPLTEAERAERNCFPLNLDDHAGLFELVIRSGNVKALKVPPWCGVVGLRQCDWLRSIVAPGCKALHVEQCGRFEGFSPHDCMKRHLLRWVDVDDTCPAGDSHLTHVDPYPDRTISLPHRDQGYHHLKTPFSVQNARARRNALANTFLNELIQQN